MRGEISFYKYEYNIDSFEFVDVSFIKTLTKIDTFVTE